MRAFLISPAVSRFALPLLLFLLALPVAAADNAVRPTKLELAANFNAASVYAFFDGDANANATARMEYRTGEGQWRPGHPLTRTARGRLAGSIFHLMPDQRLEVRVTFNDPDSPARSAPLTAATRTRSDRFPSGKGKTWYVRRGGADPGDTNVFGTIQEAVNLAQPGDTIIVRSGDYFESVTIRRSGRSDAYITLRCDDTERLVGGPGRHVEHQRPRVRLVGFDNAARLGEARAQPRIWHRQAVGTFVTDEKRTVGTLTYRGLRLYHHESFQALQTAQPPLDRGWFHDAKAGKLHVRAGGDDAPEDRDLAVGVLPFGLQFEDCGHWIVEGLEFACFGGGKYSRGIDVVNSRNVVIRRCKFEAMRTGVSFRKPLAAECLVEYCSFRDSGIWTWPWKACKSHDVEGSAISIRGGAGNVARFNGIVGFFNGIDASTWGELNNESLNRDLDIHDNGFSEIGDDPLEPEGACMNVRFWNNRTDNTLQGISLAPITVGPVYVVRDRYVNFKQGAVKVSIDSKGAVYLYHVLGWTDREGSCATSVCGPWDNMHFRNCILRARFYAVEDTREHPIGCSFDYCDLFAPRAPFVKWAGKRYGKLADLPGPTFGKHLLHVEPYQSAAPDAGALAPALIDAGIVLPGINDDFRGKGPDVGPDEVR